MTEQSPDILAEAVRLHNEGDLVEAVRRYQLAVPQHGRQPGLWWNLGLARLRLNDPAGAARAFRCVLAFQPDRFDAWINLALSCRENERPDDAAPAIAAAARCRPDSPEPVELALNSGQADLACAVAGTSGDPEVRKSLSMLLKQANRLAEAEALLKLTRADDPDGETDYLLGLLLQGQERLAEAFEAYDAAVSKGLA
ncbi:MAG: tetratricopeptide repeat protein, partial [Caulobacter sp.]|nr:tetratricopeptide repeat protein [Caulobacter sp.]